jgi:hypothetical protein
VAYAAACSHQLCCLKLSDWQWGASILYGFPSVVSPRRCETQALRTRAPLDTARWGGSRQSHRRRRLRQCRRRWGVGGICWFVRFSPLSRLKKGGLQVQVLWGVLSCFGVLAGPWLPRSLWETVGGRRIPQLTLALEFACFGRRLRR